MDTSMSTFSVASGVTDPIRISCLNRTTGARITQEIQEPFAFLGRHPTNSVQLEDPSVSKKHAYLQVFKGCPFVIDLGSRTGVKIAGKNVSQGWVQSDCTLELGVFDIRITGSIDAPSDLTFPSHLSDGTPPGTLALSWGRDPNNRTLCPIGCALTLIGRDPGCNLRLVSGRVRAFHAAIIQTASDAWLVDLRGSGETRINDRPVRTSFLRVGDRISLNGVILDVILNRSQALWSDKADALETIPEKSGVYVTASQGVQPLAEQVGDLRQATMLMAGLFAEMKREQTSLMQRQIELMEVMTLAFREFRPVATQPHVASLPVAEKSHAAPPHTPLQTPRVAKPSDEETLATAHEWFLSRLQNLGKPPT